jgi:hypothetical protein
MLDDHTFRDHDITKDKNIKGVERSLLLSWGIIKGAKPP